MQFGYSQKITQKYIFTLIVKKRLSGNHIYEKVNFYFFEMLIQNTHFKFKAYIAQTIEKFSYIKKKKKKGHYPSVGGLRHSSQSCWLNSQSWTWKTINAFGWKETTLWEFMPIQKTNKKTNKHDLENIYIHRLIWLVCHYASKNHINLTIKKHACLILSQPFPVSKLIRCCQWHDVVETIKILL